MSLSSKRARKARRAYERRKRVEHIQAAYVAMAEHFFPPKPEPTEKRLAEALRRAGLRAVTAAEMGDLSTEQQARQQALVRERIGSYGTELEVLFNDAPTIRVDATALDHPGAADRLAANLRAHFDHDEATIARPARARRLARSLPCSVDDVEHLIATNPDASDGDIDRLARYHYAFGAYR